MSVAGAYPPLTREEVAGASGRGVRVLVLDSGVDVAHPALGGAAIGCWRAEEDENGGRRVEADAPGDAYGHGTAVAAIVREFATGAAVDSLRVLGKVTGWSHLVIEGLFWGIERGYPVINCSFTTPDEACLSDYKTAVDRAFCRNVLIVAACNNADYSRVEYPGSFPSVLSTTYGRLEGMELRRRPGRLVEFVARGEGIRVAWKDGGYRTMSGSSFAAPHVAALAARVRELRPGWNACQVKAFLYEWARG